MAGAIFQVRVPSWARRHFGGSARLTKRFRDVGLGAAWQRRVLNQIEALRQGAEAHAAGIPARLRPITLRAAAEGWLQAMQRRPRTIESYRWALVHAFRLAGKTQLKDFGASEWDDYVQRRRGEGATADALNRERQALQAAAKWAASRGFAVDGGIFAVPKIKSARRVVRRFDPHAMERAIARLEGRDRVIAELLAGTGLRAGELRAAKVEWVRWHDHILEVPHSEEFSPKGGRERRVPLTPQLERRLRDWVGGRRAGLLFPPESWHSRATGLAMQQLRDRLRKVLPINGLHDLRHHYISQLAARGVDVVPVQELAGHTELKTTQLYMHARPGYMADVRRAMTQPLAGASFRFSITHGVWRWSRVASELASDDGQWAIKRRTFRGLK